MIPGVVAMLEIHLISSLLYVTDRYAVDNTRPQPLRCFNKPEGPTGKTI